MPKRESNVAADAPDKSKRPPYPKRKVAIMMGYCGSNYQGMQLNPNVKTIERELFDALCKDGLVSTENAVDPKKISWMRACRTDKGVHAAGQVVSLKMLVRTDLDRNENHKMDEFEALEATVPRLNRLLPSDIRIFGIKRAANSFHSKERCDSRFYEYLLPTYALAPLSSPEPYLNPVSKPFEDGNKMFGGKLRKNSETSSEEEEEENDDDGDEKNKVQSTLEDSWECRISEEDKKLIQTYRIPDERLEDLKGLLHGYEGSRWYHNFTIGRSMDDFSTRRIIRSVTVGNPFVKDNVEWVSLVFHGQSFMLHQIRKMVGLAIMALRLNCDWQALLAHCFEKVKVNIPKAPALGLLLDKAVFTNYNSKFAGNRDAIDFDEFEEERRKLKETMIYPKIFEEEAKFHRFMGWIKCNDDHASEFGFLVPFILSKPSRVDHHTSANDIDSTKKDVPN